MSDCADTILLEMRGKPVERQVNMALHMFDEIAHEREKIEALAIAIIRQLKPRSEEEDSPDIISLRLAEIILGMVSSTSQVMVVEGLLKSISESSATRMQEAPNTH
jgi:hypothetical protein